jgi:hypothetical protein
VPVIDVATGGVLFLETSMSAGEGSTITRRPGVAAALIGTSALLVASGLVGFHRVAQCQAATEEAEHRQTLMPFEVAARRPNGDAWLAAGAPPEGVARGDASAGSGADALDAGAAP